MHGAWTVRRSQSSHRDVWLREQKVTRATSVRLRRMTTAANRHISVVTTVAPTLRVRAELRLTTSLVIQPIYLSAR